MHCDNSVVDCLNQTIDEDTEEVLRDSINASEEIRHEQSPQPLKSVVEEEPDHSNMCEDEIPKEGMCFDSCAEAHAFYKNYASKVGFLVKIKTTNYLQNDSGEKIIANQSILCNKHGNRTSRVNAPIRYKKIASVMCNARVYVKLDRVTGKWFYAIFVAKHTHHCSPQKTVHYHEYRALSLHAKCVIEDNDETGIRPNKTYLAFSNELGGSSDLNFSERDVRNYISSKLRTSDVNLEVKEILMYFHRMQEINQNFFYEVEVDENYRLKSAFWADARSIASYEYFGDVVSFDTTYKKNRHGLPFASFIGVNHHGKSTPLGCALLGNEEIPSFEWLFTHWLRCMGSPPS